MNRIGDLRRVAGLRHRFDTEQPTLLDLELVNNGGGGGGGRRTSRGAGPAASVRLFVAYPAFV